MCAAYHPLEVDEAEPLAYVIANNDEVWAEEPPVLGARSIVELETILSLASADLENKRLVPVSQESQGGVGLEVLAPLAYPPTRCQPCVSIYVYTA